jgi:hypothetical protein
MQLEIKHPYKNEKYLITINTSKNEGQTVYKLTYVDKRLNDMYGVVSLIRNADDLWKFPEKLDFFLISLISEIIFQIMNNEVQNN